MRVYLFLIFIGLTFPCLPSQINSEAFDDSKDYGILVTTWFYDNLGKNKIGDFDKNFTEEFWNNMGKGGLQQIKNKIAGEIGKYESSELRSLTWEGDNKLGYIHISLQCSYSKGHSFENFIIEKKGSSCRIKSYLVNLDQK